MLQTIKPRGQRHLQIKIDAWLSVAVLVGLLYYSAFLPLHGSTLLLGPDPYWHIKTGQWILAHWQFPTVDFFSYTAAGKPWISTEWLSDILLASAYNIGGWRGVVILGALTCAGILAVVCFYLVQHLRFSVAVGWAFVTEAMISPHFLARPHLFSFVLLSIWMIKLLDAYDYDKFDFKSLWTFVPLMVLWANLHGSFTFGLAMLYVFAGFSFLQRAFHRHYADCLRLLIVAAVVTLSASLTPYGIKPALVTKEVLDMTFTNSHIIELRSLNFQQWPILLAGFVGLVSGILVFGVRLHGARLIAFAIILAAGLSYARGMIMFFLLAPFILARPVSESASYLAMQFSAARVVRGEANSDPVLRILARRAHVVAAACLAIAIAATAATWRQDYAPPKSVRPQAAIDYVRSANITGNVFNNLNFGGFLIISGIPTFVDSRNLPFGDDFMHRYFDAINVVDIAEALALLDKYKVTWVLIGPSDPLAKVLARDANWNEVFSDKYSIVFVRRTSTPASGKRV